MIGALVAWRYTTGCTAVVRGVIELLPAIRRTRLLHPGQRWWGSSEDGSVSVVSESLVTGEGSPCNDIEEASPYSWAAPPMDENRDSQEAGALHFPGEGIIHYGPPSLLSAVGVRRVWVGAVIGMAA